MGILKSKPFICSTLIKSFPDQSIHDPKLSPLRGRATESGAQSQEMEQEPISQSSGATPVKSVSFAKVIKVITIGDKVDQASFHCLHHFATRPRLGSTVLKNADVEQYKEAIGKL